MTFRFETKKIKQGYNYVIGCDEVGRGGLAGPVVAAAVAFDYLKTKNFKLKISEIRDSKMLLPEKREHLAGIIKECSLWSIGEVSSKVVDKINVHHATLLAMRKAVEGVPWSLYSSSKGFPRYDRNKYFISIDGKFKIPDIAMHQQAIIDGDNKVLSIAAASIIAKVHRDSLMTKLHQDYPIYNFAQHKGYGTLYHRKAIITHGLSPLHRLSFCENLTV